MQELEYIATRLINCSIDSVSWLLSDHANLIGRAKDEPKIVNSKTWLYLSAEMVAQFHTNYDDYFSQFDVFIVGHPASFALLFAKYGKPVIMYNSCRYDLPFCWNRDTGTLQLFNNTIRDLTAKNKLLVVSNNLADHDYIQAGCPGVISNLIPTLGDYSKIQWEPNWSKTLIYSGEELFQSTDSLDRRSSLGVFKEQDLGSYSGIIHIPYEVSTMSYAEHYSSGVPLYFPSLRFCSNHLDYFSNKLQSRYWLHRGQLSCPVTLLYLHQGNWLNWWLSRADFYHTLTEVNYFDSLKELTLKLESGAIESANSLSPQKRRIRTKNILGHWRVAIDTLLQ